MSDEASRIPVLIGVGQVNDRPGAAEGLDSLGLMAAAARMAGADAGEGALARVDWLGVVRQISFPALRGRLCELLGTELGIAPAFAHETAQPTGDSPILLLNQAASAIGRGEARAALIVGGEALRTAGKLAEAAAAQAGEAAPAPGPFGRGKPKLLEPRHRYGLITPTDVYPLYENAARAAYGQSFAEAQAESALIWSLFSQVAAANEAAWIRAPKTPAEILTPSPENRPIAFPYTKLMVANAAVNQGAAMIVSSLAVARELGVPDSRLIYVGRGAAAHEHDDPLVRADFAHSPSMKVALERTLQLNELSVDAIDWIELYSCFPCVPKMARRVIGWPAERPASVFGGLTFGGGPIANYMTHAAASMVAALRRSGVNGLLFANGGFATHNHAIMLTRNPQPAGVFPQDYDCQSQADAVRGTAPPLDEAYAGPARIETYTVIYDRRGAPAFGVVIGRCPDGRRAIARIPGDDALIGLLTSGDAEPVGTPGRVVREGDMNRWLHETRAFP